MCVCITLTICITFCSHGTLYLYYICNLYYIVHLYYILQWHSNVFLYYIGHLYYILCVNHTFCITFHLAQIVGMHACVAKPPYATAHPAALAFGGTLATRGHQVYVLLESGHVGGMPLDAL